MTFQNNCAFKDIPYFFPRTVEGGNRYKQEISCLNRTKYNHFFTFD